MRGWRYRAALTAPLLFVATTASAEEKTKSADEEIEESKAALAESQAQTAPPLERGVAYKPSIMPWILGGVGVAAIVTGGVFFLVSLSDESKADDFEKLAAARTTNANERNDLLVQADKSDDNAKTNQTIGLVAGGAGVAFLAAGIVWAIADRPPKDPKAASAQPWIGPGIAGGSVTYAF